VVTLADGSQVTLRQYEASVVWDAATRDVLVLEADGGPLVGMALLRGSRMTMDIEVGGMMRIEMLP
jgi:predicted aspartyl protease